MEQVGQTFVFDYGDFAVKVGYLSASKLEWEQVKGPEVGTKAQETYESAQVGPGVYFLSWQEQDTAVVAQVVDFKRGVVHTTYVSPDQKVFRMKGSVHPAAKQHESE